MVKEKKTKYPQFRNPEKYMKCRVSRTPLGLAKTRTEERALERCLALATGVRTVCDVPSGPGRLFSFWRGRDYRVLGVDFSEPMVEAAREAHRSLGVEGAVAQGDAFHLADALDETPDLVACVRFAYYFDEAKRIDLLRSLAGASRRYVLVQYKSNETIKGQKNLIQSVARQRRAHRAKRFCSYSEIVHEVTRAGLVLLCIEPVGQMSDRVFVLAEKPQADPRIGETAARLHIRVEKSGGYRLLAAFLIVFALVCGQNAVERSFWGRDEAYYALGARSVLEGEWLMPRIGPVRAAERPPLMFWWIAAVSALGGGVTEWTARLANMLPGLAALAAVFVLVRRWLNPWSAMLAMAVLATSYEYWDVMTSVGPDTSTVLFLTLAWGALFDSMRARVFHRSRWVLLWGGLALAVLARGPAPLLLTVLLAGVYGVFQFGPRGVGRGMMKTRPWAGLALAAGPFALWTALAFAQEGRMAWKAWHLTEPLRHAKPWYYLFRELPSNLLPWSLLLPFVAWHLAIRWRAASGDDASGDDASGDDASGDDASGDGETPAEKAEAGGAETRTRKAGPGGAAVRLGSTSDALAVFSLCVVAVGVGALSLLPDKRDYYLLPLSPWVAILIGDCLWRWICRLAPVEVEEDCGGAQFGGMILGMRLGRVLAAVVFLLLAAMAIYSGVATEFMDSERSPRALAREADRAVDADDRLVIVDSEDPRLMFYLRERFDLSDDEQADLDRLRVRLARRSDVDLLVKDSDLKHFIAMPEVSLFVGGSADFRDRRYYVLTNDASEGGHRLRGILIDDIAGVCFHPGRGTLFAVGKGGEIAETDLDGRILGQSRLDGHLEAVAADPESGRLYVSDIENRRLIEVDPDALTAIRTYAVTRRKGSGGASQGASEADIEGMAFVNDAGTIRLFGVEKNGSRHLIEIRLSETPEGVGRAEAVAIADVSRLHLDDLSVSADGKTLLAFSERDRRLFEMTADGKTIRQWGIPGDDIEALAFGADGFLYVCEESSLLAILKPSELEPEGAPDAAPAI
ncbi:glycosyltransferase family 39 protein [Candidatus Sumerlaeota bacterium]|nr:glycosyltransferase family 39 protein [Candidatus Sumerlaeota bacterium]